MDFPSFYTNHLAGGRLIIGFITSLHVLINHPLAAGAYPLLTWIGGRRTSTTARTWITLRSAK